MRCPLPVSLLDSALAYESGQRTPAPPRDAATVVLLRDAPVGVECYLLRRRASMAFAAGMYVFPGGGVDPHDAHEVPWAGPAPQSWADRLSCSTSLARALVCAAVRETFEEAGVLLAGPAPGEVADLVGEDWEEDRAALAEGRMSLPELLQRRELLLRTDLLAAWTHWITPVFEPRRYDTRFFVAVLPAGQHARDVSTESDQVAWIAPADALARADAGDLALMPPTRTTLTEMAQLSTADEALQVARTRRIAPVLPRAVCDGDGLWLDTELP